MSRGRAYSCPHRGALGGLLHRHRGSPRASSRGSANGSPRLSPCLPCHRARIHTWATFIRSQGLARRSDGGSRVPLRHSSSVSSPGTTCSDVDADSVFGSPLAPALAPASDQHIQRQLLTATLQDPGSPHASPALAAEQDLLSLSLPLQDPLDVYSSRRQRRQPQQELLSLPRRDFGSAYSSPVPAAPFLDNGPEPGARPQALQAQPLLPLQDRADRASRSAFVNSTFCQDLVSLSPPQDTGANLLSDRASIQPSPWPAWQTPLDLLSLPLQDPQTGPAVRPLLALDGQRTLYHSECELAGLTGPVGSGAWDGGLAGGLAADHADRLTQRRATVSAAAAQTTNHNRRLGRYLSEPHR